MTTPTIEFASPSSVAESCATPWNASGKLIYQDRILKPEYASRKFKFPVGETWFRIVPALRGSNKWMLGIHALQYKSGQHVHAKTLALGAKSVFDRAYAWHRTNCPETLRSKANRQGYHLLPGNPLCAFWILVQEGEKILARIVVASKYSGEWGGTSGIGHQIWQLTQERDEMGNPLANPTDIANGVQVCIQKTQPIGSRYPSYALRLGRVPAPMNAIISRMEPTEIAALTPIENVVHLPNEEEEWSILEGVIGKETVAKIRAAT